MMDDWYAHISAAFVGCFDVMTDASRANPSSHIVMSDIGALRTNRRVADRPSFPVLGSSSHASGSKSAISTNSKSKIRFTRRAGVIGYTVRPNFRSGGPYSLREYGPPPGPYSLGNTVRLKYCTSREYSPGEEADSIP